SVYWGDLLQTDEYLTKQRLKKEGHPDPAKLLPAHGKPERHYREAVDDTDSARLMANDDSTQVLAGMLAGRAHCGLGDMASRRDRYVESCAEYEHAKREFTKVLALRPDHTEARKYLQAIEARLKSDRPQRDAATDKDAR